MKTKEEFLKTAVNLVNIDYKTEKAKLELKLSILVKERRDALRNLDLLHSDLWEIYHGITDKQKESFFISIDSHIESLLNAKNNKKD